jgi:hypothetical protein
LIDVKVRKAKKSDSQPDSAADILNLIETSEQREELINDLTESIYQDLVKEW